MAIIHRATLSPTKLDLLTEYLPNVAALAPFATNLEPVGAYRFDDPAGDVGIETHILTNADGVLLQVPLTYRSQPVDGAKAALLGTMEHSVLGKRWVYNACGEAVYVIALAETIGSGGAGAREMVETPDGPIERAPSVTVRGSGASSAAVSSGAVEVTSVGSDTHMTIGDITVVLRQVLDAGESPAGSRQLEGNWAAIDTPVVLASLS